MPSIMLPDGSEISYLLKRSPKRRSIGLRIGTDGLQVSAPSRLSLKELGAILASKAGWIQQKLSHQQAHATPEVNWQNGEKLLFLGNEIQLYLAKDSKNRAVEFDGARLDVRMPNTDETSAVQRKIIQWYKQQALNDFNRRTALLAQKLGVPTPPVILSSARTRWGSCNSRGEIRLSWRLIQAPAPIIYYVVAHELAHLKEMNHSAKFWAIVENLCPEYRQIERKLKTLSAKLHAM